MIELVLVGDVMLGRRVRGCGVFKNVKNILSADVKFANLESPFGDGFDFIDGKKYVFSAPNESGEFLKLFDVVSLANNHIVDCGKGGIDNTIDVLNKNDVNFVGVKENEDKQNPIIIEKKGIKIGFLAYCKDRVYLRDLEIGPYLIDDGVVEDVKNAKKKVDFLVVSLHWGREHNLRPSEKQVELARSLIDNGANLVVGHHSLVVQKVEEYNNGLIAYSLGNFVFDQKFNSLVRRGLILKVSVGDGIEKYECIDSYINDDFEVEVR